MADQPSAERMLKSAAGWWVQHFPLGELDHVWRVLENAHISAKSFGSVVNLRADGSLGAGSAHGGELEVRALVKDVDEVSEMKRVGAALLAVAPNSTRNDAIFFQRGALKAGPRESKARIEERSEWKIEKCRAEARRGARRRRDGAEPPLVQAVQGGPGEADALGGGAHAAAHVDGRRHGVGGRPGL